MKVGIKKKQFLSLAMGHELKLRDNAWELEIRINQSEQRTVEQGVMGNHWVVTWGSRLSNGRLKAQRPYI